MANELKTTVINMKSLNQNIPDPVVVGAGDANGRTLRVIFTQEAAAQMTEDTKVYLSWHHQEVDIKGYNVFTHIINEEDEDFPPTWEIKYPKSMLYEGNVLACIQLVDHVSIATSTNFMIHVLIDPNDGSKYTATDDFTEFQNAVISLATLSDEMRRQMTNQKIEFEDMQLEFIDVRQVVQDANLISEQAKDIAEQALQTAQNALNTIIDLTEISRNARDLAQEANENVTQLNQEIEELKERLSQEEDIVEAINNVANSALEIAKKIEETGCCGGITEEEMLAAINTVREELTLEIENSQNNLSEDVLALKEELEDKILQTQEQIISQYKADLINALSIKEFI